MLFKHIVKSKVRCGEMLAALLVASAATLLPNIGAFAAENDMTIVSWGGAYSKAQHNAYDKPFMAKTGVNIINDDTAAEAVARLRAMNETGNVTYDIVDIIASDALRVCDEGLLVELDFDKDLAPSADGSSIKDDFGDFLVSDCSVPLMVYSTVFGYRTDSVGNTPPSSVCDVFDLKKYPGKRALEKRPVNNVEWALLCDGVAKADIYTVLETPEGVQRALRKLDTIKDHVIWWSAGAETPQLLADGEVVMGSTYNGRLFSAIEESKQPIAILWDGQVQDFSTFAIPAGLSEKRLKRAKEYIKFVSNPQILADLGKFISYGPARASAAPLVPPHATLGVDMKPHMPTNAKNSKNALLFNYEFWADFRDDIDKQFQAWLAR